MKKEIKKELNNKIADVILYWFNNQKYLNEIENNFMFKHLKTLFDFTKIRL